MEESQTKQRPGTNKLYLISALKDLTTFSILNLRELKENEGLLLQEETALSSLIEQQNKGDDLTKSINKASESLLDKKNHEIKLLNEQGRLANLIRTIQQQIEQKQQDIVVSQEQEAKTYKIESQDYQKEKRQYKEILRKYDLQSKEFKMSSRLKKQFQKIKKSKQNRKQIEESKEIKKNQDEKKGKIKDQKKSESKRDLNKINTEEEQEQVNLSENEMQNMNIVNEQVEEEEKKIKDFSVNIPFEQTYIDQIKDNLDSKDEEKKILQSESTGKEENIITHDKFENDDFNRIPENNTQKDYGQLSKVIQQLMLEIKNLTTKQEEQQIINQKFFENQEKRGKEIEDLGKRIEDQEKKIREIEKKIEENGKGIPEIENEIDNQQGTYEKQEKTNQEIKIQIIKLSETYLIQGEEIKSLKKKQKEFNEMILKQSIIETLCQLFSQRFNDGMSWTKFHEQSSKQKIKDFFKNIQKTLKISSEDWLQLTGEKGFRNAIFLFSRNEILCRENEILKDEQTSKEVKELFVKCFDEIRNATEEELEYEYEQEDKKDNKKINTK